MTIPTFEPIDEHGIAIGPKPGYSREKNPKTKNNPFGDNYTQTIPDGINNLLIGPVDLVLELLTWEQALAFEAFMDNLTGTQPFLYVLPPDSLARTWKCAKYSMMPVAGGIASFNFQIQEIPS